MRFSQDPVGRSASSLSATRWECGRARIPVGRLIALAAGIDLHTPARSRAAGTAGTAHITEGQTSSALAHYPEVSGKANSRTPSSPADGEIARAAPQVMWDRS